MCSLQGCRGVWSYLKVLPMEWWSYCCLWWCKLIIKLYSNYNTDRKYMSTGCFKKKTKSSLCAGFCMVIRSLSCPAECLMAWPLWSCCKSKPQHEYICLKWHLHWLSYLHNWISGVKWLESSYNFGWKLMCLFAKSSRCKAVSHSTCCDGTFLITVPYLLMYHMMHFTCWSFSYSW